MNLPNMMEAENRCNKKNEYIYLNNNIEKIYEGKKYYIKTYGCQMNVHDSEQISYLLESLGFTKTENFDSSDLVLLNTCAIRENAHDKFYGFLGRCKHLKQEKKNLIIAICGCMAQEESVVNEILEKNRFVDIVFGTHNIHELVDMLKQKQEKLNINVLSNSNEVIENIKYKRDSNITAWINIMYGCDKFCTYCIVPYTRGKQRSRKSIDIINEVKELLNKGYKEITLLGQNVNAYGKDLDGEIEFSKLLELVSDTGIERIRFVTSHPWDFTSDMIDTIATHDNIMPYIHLPLQSGSNNILKLMGRRYTKEDYLKLFHDIKKRIPNVSITTDIIVGFPNETEDDFNDTLSIVDECKFDGAFTFIFSPRENTPASKMKDSISLEEKEKRLQILNQKVNYYYLLNNKKLLNKVVKVLIVGISEKDNTKVYGYTDTMKLVNVDANKESIGKIIDVLITDAKSFSLDGVLYDSNHK